MSVIWMLVLIAGLLVDILTSGFLFSIFSLSALGTLLLNMLNVSIGVQVCVFAILSIVLIFTLVPFIRRKIKASETEFITQEKKLIGREIILSKDLVETDLVNIDGVFWTIKANSEPIKSGAKVKLVSLEGNKYVVEEIRGDDSLC